MPLFRRNNESLKFDIVGLDDDALEEITALVLQNGGKILHDDTQPIKFTKPYQFVQSAFPGAKLYDIQFIKECIGKNEIVDPVSYRIGKPLQYDNCVMAHFLGATCDCCISKVTCAEPKERNTQNGSAKSKVTCAEPTERNTQNGSAKRVADNVNDNSREVRRRPAMQINDNTENDSESMVKSPNRASNTPPKMKIELASPSKRKSDSSDSENTLTVILDNRVRGDKSQATRGRKRGRGVAITRAEELAVLKYLTDHHVILEAATGLQVWEEMIKSGICRHRTANSLYSHFKKSILPNITRYKLTEHHLKKFNKIKNM